MKTEQAPFEYLLSCSRFDLNSYMLARQNGAAEARKEIGILLDTWVEQASLAELAEMLRQLGEKLIAEKSSGIDSSPVGAPANDSQNSVVVRNAKAQTMLGPPNCCF